MITLWPGKAFHITDPLWGESTGPGLLMRTWWCYHYIDVTMGAIPFQITSLTIVYSILYSGADQRKHQSSAPLAFVRGIHRSPVNSPHKRPVTRKMFPFDDVIMLYICVHMVDGQYTEVWTKCEKKKWINKSIFVCWCKFPRISLVGVQLIARYHWFRQWLGTEEATIYYLSQWWSSALIEYGKSIQNTNGLLHFGGIINSFRMPLHSPNGR